MADSYTLNAQVFGSGAAGRGAPSRKGQKRATGLALAAGAVLALAPVAVTTFVHDRAETVSTTLVQPEASLVAFPERAVELDGAIMQFSQQGNAINLGLMANDDGQRVFVQDAAGELFEIAVSPGQTQVSAELPAHFAASQTLTVRVD